MYHNGCDYEVHHAKTKYGLGTMCEHSHNLAEEYPDRFTKSECGNDHRTNMIYHAKNL